MTLKNENDLLGKQDDFFLMLAHELRTPLKMAEMGTSKLLEGLLGPLTDQQKAALDRNSKCLRRIGKLVDNLLELSRLKEGKLSVNVGPVNLSALALDVLDLFADHPRFATLEVIKNLPLEIPDVIGDSMMLSEVMINLFGNAIRYAKSKISVTVSMASSRKQELVFELQNDGEHIPQDRLESIFTKPIRFDSEAALKRGTGLGLAISQEMIRQNHGRIGVENRQPSGVSFYFSLPLHTEPVGS